jgi:hypothetical protein
MTKTDSTKVMWQVQVRGNRDAAWRNRGRFETRSNAREKAAALRDVWGMWNTRVMRVVKGA